MNEPTDPRFGEEGGGYIHPPDEMEDRSQGLVCFLNQNRMCGPDCMAYTSYTPNPPSSELGEQSRNCSLLVNLERLGKHAVIGVGLFSRMEKSRKIADADAQRMRSQTPPNPLAKP